MFRALGSLMLLLPLVASADVDARFAKMRDMAEPVQSLGGFLDKYVGDCGSVLEGGADCKKNSEAFRRAANGKKFYMMITEDSSSMLSLGNYSPGSGDVTINLTPFFPASNSAVTHGAPSRTDENGNPVMPFIALKGTLPEGWNPQMMGRQLQAGAMRLQIVFTPQGLWTMSKKGGGQMHGVKAHIDAVIVTVGRTGDQIAVWINK